MGMELRHDAKADVHLGSSSEAVRTTLPVVPAAERQTAKVLVGALAVAGVLTLAWIAFLCSLIERIVGTF
jgi:hypothetical protein